jgi:hypothetical protein
MNSIYYYNKHNKHNEVYISNYGIQKLIKQIAKL